MASSSVPTVPKTQPRRNMKRIMLAKHEEPPVNMDKETQDRIVDHVCEFLKGLKSRDELDKAVMLGFNSISRKAEQCDEDLKIVLLNAQVKPEMMITTLSKLCVLKRIPVGRLENFCAISEALRPLVKGLKASCAALGILVSSPEDFRTRLIEKLPPVVYLEEPTVSKRVRLPPAPCPDVDVKKFYVLLSEGSTSRFERSTPRTGFGDTLSFSEGKIPMVDYESFIGSERAVESQPTPMEVEVPKGKPSKYKQPVMEYR